MWEGGPTSISHWRVGLARLGSSGLGKVRLARLGSSGSRSSSAFRTSFVPSRLFLLLLRRMAMLAQASPKPSCSPLSPIPPVIIPPIPPTRPHDLSRSIEQSLNDLSSPPPGLHHLQAVNPMDKPLTQVLETPGTSSPPPPATTALDGKEEDAAATAAGAASKPADVIRSARSLLFGRLQGRGWPGGSVSGRVWLGVGRDDD